MNVTNPQNETILKCLFFLVPTAKIAQDDFYEDSWSSSDDWSSESWESDSSKLNWKFNGKKYKISDVELDWKSSENSEWHPEKRFTLFGSDELDATLGNNLSRRHRDLQDDTESWESWSSSESWESSTKDKFNKKGKSKKKSEKSKALVVDNFFDTESSFENSFESDSPIFPGDESESSSSDSWSESWESDSENKKTFKRSDDVSDRDENSFWDDDKKVRF